MQVCELLQVLTEALKNQCSWNSKTHYLKILLKSLKIMCKEVHF